MASPWEFDDLEMTTRTNKEYVRAMGNSQKQENSKESEVEWGIYVILYEAGGGGWGDQSSATTKYAFWNIDFKLVFQKQKT